VTSRPVRTGSYDPVRTTAGGLTAELARLDAQAELSFAEEARLYAELGLVGAGPLLEVGAGSGAVTRRLRARWPDLDVIALDLDPVLQAAAAGAGAPRLRADAVALPLPDASVGGVLLRYVLQHTPDPARVLAEARRVLRPGGALVVVDVDDALIGLVEPSFPELVPIFTRLARAQGASGGDRLIGRRLSRLLRAAGFDDVLLRPFSISSDDHPIEHFALHLGPDRLAPLVAAGQLSLADFRLAGDRWRALRTDPDAWIMLLGLLAAGRAPAGLPPSGTDG
jgi:SAM-dependent methyltransferase